MVETRRERGCVFYIGIYCENLKVGSNVYTPIMILDFVIRRHDLFPFYFY